VAGASSSREEDKMRKLFLGTALTSLMAAVLIGGALAWTGSTSGSSTATAGEVAVAFYDYVQINNPVVPTGNPIKVARGGLTNTGDIQVYVTGGSVTGTGNSPGCGVTGSVVVTDNNWLAVGESRSNLYDVYLTMATNAHDGCQNAALGYDITINVSS
jgi:hypothetical protein